MSEINANIVVEPIQVSIVPANNNIGIEVEPINLEVALGTNQRGAGGTNTQVQFNDAGILNGNANMTFNKSTALFTVRNANITGNINVVGTTTIANTMTVQQIREKIEPNATGSTGTINYDLLTSAIVLKTANATANFTLNFRGNATVSLNTMLSSNQSITCTFINTNGNTGYFANTIQIDGSNRTPIWAGGAQPSAGTINGKDVYTFNIMKTASNTYTIFGSIIGFI